MDSMAVLQFVWLVVLMMMLLSGLLSFSVKENSTHHKNCQSKKSGRLINIKRFLSIQSPLNISYSEFRANQPSQIPRLIARREKEKENV